MTHSETFQAIIEINQKQAMSQVEQLRKEQKAAAEELSRLKQKDSGATKEQIALAEKRLKTVSKMLQQETRHVKGLDAAMQQLSEKTYKDLKSEVRSLNKMMRDGSVEKNSEEWKALAERIKAARREMKEYEDATRETEKEPIWKRFIVGLNTHWGAITQIIGAITGLTVAVRSSVKAYADMEEAMADTRKYTGLADEAIRELNEDLKAMDTRTSRQELNELAGAAGRLGKTSKQDILDFVEAGDMIKVALGDDLGDGAIDKVGKLALAFGEDKTKGLRGAMLATGSAINELAQNSSAQAGYLVDFTARVAGFGKQLGLTQAQIMGFGAVMDENMLRDEMAATAFGNMLTKMQTDTAKFAKIAGMDMKSFTELLNKDANAAILALADNLKKADAQTMMKMLDDMGLDGSRAVGVLSTLADKIDDVRARQDLATKAYDEGVSVQKEFATMNNTVEAGIDKAKKKFQEIAIELGQKLMPIVKYTISSTSMIIRLLSALITWISENKASVIMLTAALGALILKKQADILITKAEIFWSEKFIATLKRLWLTFINNPLGVMAVSMAMVLGMLVDLHSKTKKVAESEDNLDKIRNRAKKSMVEEEMKVRNLIKASKDESLSKDERMKAINKLNEIMPGYIKNLDKETLKYDENKKALDDYLKSLTRKYEIEGAKEMLGELGKAMAELTVEQQKAQEALEGAQALTNKNQGNKSIFNTYNAAQSNFVVANEQKAVNDLDKINKQLAEKKKEHDRILKAYGIDLYNDDKKETEDTGTTTTTTYVTDTEKKKQEAEAEKARRERLEKMREADKKEKAIMDARLAENMMNYQAGLQGYLQYIANQEKIQKEGLEARRDVWDKDSAEYAKYQKQLAVLQKNGEKERNRLTEAEMERFHQMMVARLKAEFEDENSALYHNEEALNDALHAEDMEYLKQKAGMYRKGSLERMQQEWQIKDREDQHMLEKEVHYQQMLDELKTGYLQQGDAKREQMELNALETLKKQGLLKEEEYQRARLAIKAQYAQQQTPDEKTAAAGNDMLKVASAAAAKDAGNGTSGPIVGTIQMYSATMDKLKELYGQDEQNHAAYLAAKQQATAQFCQQLASEFQTAYQGVSQIMSSLSALYSAQADYETAIVRKKYEKQIAAAGNNQKRVKKLQEKQAKEEAAIKSKYNKKQVKIQIAQAIAQTAQNALLAYGSVLVPGVPWTYALAAVASAMALASGAIQIAAIKKQAQAQEAGYYEGGFTGGRRYRKEAGVVHEGEFVANHQAVNNPNVMPLLQLLDRAQRDNTVGSLTAEDISRQLGGGSSAVVTPIVNIKTDNEELRTTMEGMKESVDDLNDILDEGIDIIFPMDRFDRNYRHYTKLKDRP